MERIRFGRWLVMAALILVAQLATADVRDTIKADMQAGRWSQAEVELSQVLAKHPDNATAHYWMAIVQEKEGHASEARQHLVKAKELKPDLSFSGDKQLLEQMENRLNDVVAHSPVPVERSAISSSSQAQSSSHWLWWAGLGLIGLVGIVFWRSRVASAKAVEEERSNLRSQLKAVRADLADAVKAVDGRPELLAEQKFALTDRINQAVADVSHADYTVANGRDFSSVYSVIERGHDLAAEARGEEKPSERMRREKAAAAEAAAVAAPVSPTTVVVNQGGDSGLLTGVLIGEMMSGHGANSGSHRARDDGYQPISTASDRRESDRGALDLGGGSDSDAWDSSPSSSDTSSSSDSGDSWS